MVSQAGAPEAEPAPNEDAEVVCGLKGEDEGERVVARKAEGGKHGDGDGLVDADVARGGGSGAREAKRGEQQQGLEQLQVQAEGIGDGNGGQGGVGPDQAGEGEEEW